MDTPEQALPSPVQPTPPQLPQVSPLPSAARTLRLLVQVLALFVSFFILVRTVFVEPFGVPTGSMATTLSGNHREGICPRCGYRMSIGTNSNDEVRKGDPPSEGVCSNCGYTSVQLSGEIPGDRLLVDKTVFQFRDPRRWEVAVFRCPVDDSKPYVKRVVGLGGEQIRIFDGDIYTDGILQRKSLHEIRDCRILVFDMNFGPEGGWTSRWEIKPIPPEQKLPLTAGATLPSVEEVILPGRIVLHATDRYPAFGLVYRHRNLDTQKDESLVDTVGYNGALRGVSQAVHDFQMECEVEVLGGSGSLACRLGDGADTVRVEIPVGSSLAGPRPSASLAVDGAEPASYSTASNDLVLEASRRYRLVFSFVDRRAQAAIDGVLLTSPIDLTPPARTRPGINKPLQLGVRGASIVIHELRLYRDVHYRDEGRNVGGKACQLGPLDYFMLGDNTANSEDSRVWITPGVPRASFLGKPFLIHQPLKAGRIRVNGNDWPMQLPDWDRFRLLN